MAYIIPTIKPPERILAIGVGGTGKSSKLLDIARKVQGKFYIIDNDFSYDRLLATEYRDVEERGNYEVCNADVGDWESLVPQINTWSEDATRDDWLVIDSITPTWDAVREWYSERAIGDDLSDFMLKMKAATKTAKEFGAAVSDQMNYDIINKQYNKLYTALFRWPGNVWVTAELAMVDGNRDDKEIRSLFGVHGVKPKGQKRLGHITSTVLLFTKHAVSGEIEFRMTTIKDRGRGEMVEVPVGDFATDYLMKVAGWKIERKPKPAETMAEAEGE